MLWAVVGGKEEAGVYGRMIGQEEKRQRHTPACVVVGCRSFPISL